MGQVSPLGGVPRLARRLLPLPQHAPSTGLAALRWLGSGRDGWPPVCAAAALRPAFAACARDAVANGDVSAESAGVPPALWAAFSAVAGRRAPGLAAQVRPGMERPAVPEFSWRAAQADALAALGLLHPHLEDRARALLLAGRVDAAPRPAKPAQPFSLPTPEGPVVSLWWAGDGASAATLAHELGHASAQAVRSGPAPARALDEVFALMAEMAFHAHRVGAAGAQAHRAQHAFDFLIRQTAAAWAQEGGDWPAAFARAAPHLAPCRAPTQRPGEARAYALAAAIAFRLAPRVLGDGRGPRATYLHAVMHAQTLEDLLAAFDLTGGEALFEAAFDAAEAFAR